MKSRNFKFSILSQELVEQICKKTNQKTVLTFKFLKIWSQAQSTVLVMQLGTSNCSEIILKPDWASFLTKLISRLDPFLVISVFSA